MKFKMTKMQKEKATMLISKLNFDDCVKTFNKIERGHPLIDLLFDRMESIDAEKFDRFLDHEGEFARV